MREIILHRIVMAEGRQALVSPMSPEIGEKTVRKVACPHFSSEYKIRDHCDGVQCCTAAREGMNAVCG